MGRRANIRDHDFSSLNDYPPADRARRPSGDAIVTTPSLTELAEECRNLMRTARETASRLEFVAEELAARAAWIDDTTPQQKRTSGDKA
jgi:hypothetical protein